MRPLEFLRGVGCVDVLLPPILHGAVPQLQPTIRRRDLLPPSTSTRHAPYPHPDDAATPTSAASRVERLIEAASRGAGAAGTTTPLNLWLDEYGYQTNPPDKLRGVTPGLQDRYMQEAAYQAWRNPRVQLFAQYLWKDERPGRRRAPYTGWQSGLNDPRATRSPRSPTSTTRSGSTSAQASSGARCARRRAHEVTVQRREPARRDWETLATLATHGRRRLADLPRPRSRTPPTA